MVNANGVAYISSKPNGVIESFLDRIFYSRIRNVSIVSNKRVIKLDELVQMKDIKDTFYIFERATVDGFRNGSLQEMEELVYDGGNVLNNKAKIIKCEPITGNMFNTILSDDGSFILHSYEGKVLITCTELHNFDRTFLEWVFENEFELKPMNEVEFFTEKLKKISSKINMSKMNEYKKKMSDAQSHMSKAFKTFNSQRDIYLDSESRIKGLKGYDNDQTKAIREQIQRLLSSPFLESLQLEGDNFIMVTKPLTMGLWNIGQYIITYRPRDSIPIIKRMDRPEETSVKYPIRDGGRMTRKNSHPHTDQSGYPCAGNYHDMLGAFWNKDMLMGFNSAVIYIKSYHERGRPSVALRHWLVGMGYLNDARIVYEYSIDKIENGKLMRGRKELTEAELRKMGMTGEIETNPEKYAEYHKTHPYQNAGKLELSKIEYHAYGE